MARRTKRDRAKILTATPAPRTASPRRELLGLNSRNGIAASALATGSVFGTAAAGLPPTVSASAAAVIAAGFAAKVKGRTLGEWLSLRRNVSRLPEQAALFSRDGVGIVFDGRTASVCVQITPRAWQPITITATGESEAPTLTAEQLRPLLHQYDIRCSRITAVCAGYKFAARDVGAGVLDTLIGPVSAPLGGMTVIVVSVDLDADILDPAYRRARREVSGELSLPSGLCRTAVLAATRVSHALAENGFGSRLMSDRDVREFQDAALAQLVSPLTRPAWDHCGDTNGIHTRTYAPARGHWNALSAGAWHHLQSHRQYTTLTLTPAGEGKALAQPLITYLLRGPEPSSAAVGYGLACVSGQQIAGIAQALPVATQQPLRTPGAVIDEGHHLGFGIPAGGSGLFVGSRPDRSRVFVAVSPSADPLWLCGPTLFAMQMVARLSTQDQSIAVMIDDPAWEALVEHRATPSLTAGTLGTLPVDVVVATPQWWERNRELCEGKAVILVTGENPGRLASHSLSVVDGDDGRARIAVNVDSQTIEVNWELTPIERRSLLGDVDPDSAVAPRLTGLQFPDLIQLPGDPTTPRGRRRRVVTDAAPALPVTSVEALREVASEAAALKSAAPKRPLVTAAAVPGEVRFSEPAVLPGKSAAPLPRRERDNTPPAKTVAVPAQLSFAPAASFPTAADGGDGGDGESGGRHRRDNDGEG